MTKPLYGTTVAPIGKPAKTSRTISTPATDNMRRAQKENFALFVLRGMLGNLVHLRSVVSSHIVDSLHSIINLAIGEIKHTQAQRKVDSYRDEVSK